MTDNDRYSEAMKDARENYDSADDYEAEARIDAMKARVEQLKAKLHEMNQPGYYGSWCSGYLKAAFQKELAELNKILNIE